MKGYRWTSFESLDCLVCQDELESKPQRGELLIQVRAVSLNFRDIAMLGGRYPQPYHKGLIPTSDAAGEIIAMGENTDDFKIGDRVMGTFHTDWFAGRKPANLAAKSYGSARDGWLVERKVVAKDAVVRIPSVLSYEQASTLPCAAVTAWSALSGDFPIRAGQTVLVQGTGGVSVFALQLAKAVGAAVIATTSSAEKEDKLRSLGASHVVNYKTDPNWGDSVRKLTGDEGVDVVIEVGGPATFAQSMLAVKPDGEIASIGFLSHDNAGIDFFALKRCGATVRQISVGSREALKQVAAAIAMNEITPVIDKVFPFGEAKEAFNHLRRAGHIGKIVIRL